MTVPDRCSRCRRDAVAHQPYSGRALCADHLVRDVESRARRAVRQQAGLRHGDRVGLLLPGGPHGAALLAFAQRQFGRRRDLSLVALVPAGTPVPDLPEPVEGAVIGEDDPLPAALRQGCSVLLLPATLEERAADVLGAVLAGRPAILTVAPERVRLVRPFEHVPGLELRLYLGAVAGTVPPPAPPAPAGPFDAFVADELARHASRHPSAPFALVRLAETLSTLAAGERQC